MSNPAIRTYLAEQCTMPFCKGCGHTHVLRKLNDALVKLQLPPQHISLVTDIGCIGLADALFGNPHTVHTTHGRSTAFATGIELADAVLENSKLKTIVLIGDGGAMIGLLHLVNAALLNVDVTVLLCNNFLFGMTGGQHSAFSPEEFITPTTPTGNMIPPIDLCKVMIDSRADFVARKLATDRDLADTIAQAIQHPGFSLVEIVELCTEHGTSRNELTGSVIKNVLEKQGQPLGQLASPSHSPRREFGLAYACKHGKDVQRKPLRDDSITPHYRSGLKYQAGIVIAGSAGERVQSSARKLCEAAVLSGLAATQKNDNPVTQGSGFSLSEVVLSPEEILFTGIEIPTAVIIVSSDGWEEIEERKLLKNLPETSVVLLDTSLPDVTTKARTERIAFRQDHGAASAALRAIEYYVQKSAIIPLEAFQEVCAD